MSRSVRLILHSGASAAGSDAMDNYNARVPAATRTQATVDAVLGNRAPIVSKRRIANGWGYQNLCRCSTFIWDPLDLGSSITDQGRDVWSVISSYFPATVELAAFSMAVALIIGLALVCFPHAPGTIFDMGEAVWNYYLCAPIFWAGMLMQLIFAVQLRWFPLGFPPRCHRPLVRRDFTQLIVCSVVI